MEDEAVIRDLRQSLDRAYQDRDRWKEIAYSLAQYQANANDSSVFQIIEDEEHHLIRQKQWSITEGINE